MQAAMIYLVNSPAGEAMMRGGPRGGFFLGGLLTAVWAALLVLLVLWIVRNWSTISTFLRRTAATAQASAPTVSAPQPPLEILQSRYAKGELTREEYETIRRDLVGEAPAASA